MKQHKKGVDTLTIQFNEYTYIINFFSEPFTQVCEARKDLWNCSWGKVKLQASKTEENLAKKGFDRCSSGSSIDCIVSVEKCLHDVMMIEVSGPNNKENYEYLLEDCIKLAKNMKRIIKYSMWPIDC